MNYSLPAITEHYGPELFDLVPQTTVIFFHANCDDGFGAAWAARQKLMKSYHGVVIYQPVKYGEVPDFASLLGAGIYILDFSFSEEIICKLAGVATFVVLLDHHKTAQETIGHLQGTTGIDNLDVQLDMSRSGAMLAWNYFHDSSSAPLLIEHIQDGDLWRFNFPKTKVFQLALRSYPQTFDSWDRIHHRIIHSNGYDVFCSEGETINRYYRQKLEEVKAAGKRRCWLPNPNDDDGLACNAPPMFASDLATELAAECGTYGVTWFLDSRDTYIYSLRSIGDYDVATIAQRFGGGGHKNAAGFKSSHSLEFLMQNSDSWNVAK